MIYVIMGMHKSGTTLISEILHKSGINMGDFDEAKDYDGGNKYERYEVNRLNKDITGSENKDSLNILTPLSVDSVDKKYLVRMREFIDECEAKYTNWGVKDPRLCLTYPIWREVLPEHRLIIVFRHPLEVWHHYQEKTTKGKLKRGVIRSWKAITAWYVYNNEVMKYISDKDEIIINYSKFMGDDEQFKHLENFVGMELTDQRKPSLYRSKQKTHIMFLFFSLIQSLFFSRNVSRLYAEIERSRVAI